MLLQKCCDLLAIHLSFLLTFVIAYHLIPRSIFSAHLHGTIGQVQERDNVWIDAADVPNIIEAAVRLVVFIPFTVHIALVPEERVEIGRASCRERV